MYIAVAGNLGSGKSTVAEGLAKAFNCDLYPKASYERSYIEDLFRNPQRWTAEAQISFMVHKHDAIRAGLDSGRLFIVDRTFSEEVNVFAQRFYENGQIEERSMELIRQIAEGFESRIEQPSVVVFCDCPPGVCSTRLSDRPRTYQNSYPEDHLWKLDKLLRNWKESLTTPIISIRSDLLDFRLDENIKELASSVEEVIRARSPNQLDLFSHSLAPPAAKIGSVGGLRRRRQIYLAAPFTNSATKTDLSSVGPDRLFTGPEYIESVPLGYRRQLQSLARAIESHGHSVLLPHRDINRWGERPLPPLEIARRCLKVVEDSDAVIGLISESFGSHSELSYGMGSGKPVMVLLSDTLNTSFFGSGLARLPSIASMRGKHLKDLSRQLSASDPWEIMTAGGPRE